MGSKTKNTYIYPIALSREVRITYAESPAHLGNLKNSVDFICKEGTQVLAAADGVVIDCKSDSDVGGESKELEPLGNFVEILHKNKECSEYEHLRKDGVVVRVGDTVQRGRLSDIVEQRVGWLI